MEITTVGLDIAKRVFQLHGVDAAGKAVLRRKLQRSEVLVFFKALPPCLVGIEACGTAHSWLGTKTTRPAAGSPLFPVSGRSRHRRSSPLLPTLFSSTPLGTLQPGSGWCPDSTAAAANSAKGGFPNWTCVGLVERH